MKVLLFSLMLCFTSTLALSQVTVKKDYLGQNGRVIELEFNGVGYSLLLNGFNSEREARLIFKNIVSNNQVQVKLRDQSLNPMEISCNGRSILTTKRVKGRIDFIHNGDNFSEETTNVLNAFSSVMDEINPDWPGTDPEGGSEADLTWRVIGVQFGGALSLAQARCNEVFKHKIEDDHCHGTIDCHCIAGSFLCTCICGELCDY